jgi:universal stress protein A
VFDRILVPLDFTEKNQTALDVAIWLARQNQSEVTLIHVIERIDDPAANELKEFYEKLGENAKERMKDWAKRLEKENVPVQQKVVFGARPREIVNYAVKHKTSLIVLSSHRVDLENPLQGWGTVSYKVAILSQCPVLLVK